MPQGLEHLFAGLVEGVGQGTLDAEKKKLEDKHRDKNEQLQTLTMLLSLPDLQPEVRSKLFKQALEVASNGDKKLGQGVHDLLGPMMDGGQAGGVRTPSTEGAGAGAAASAPPTQQPQTAGLPKFGGGQQPAQPKLGSSGSGGQNIFQTEGEKTDLIAQRAGAVAKAQTDVSSEAEIRVHAENLKADNKNNEAQGYKLIGFTPLDPSTGKRTPIYVNELTQQQKYGAPVDPFTSLQAMQEIEVATGKLAIARNEAVNNILIGRGKDPASATPQERADAEKAYARTITWGSQLENEKTRSEIYKNVETAKAAGDRSLDKEGLDLNRQALDYNRQRDNYAGEGKLIKDEIDQVEALKAKAGEAYNQAQSIQSYLNSNGIKRGDESVQDRQQGLTWQDYDYHNSQGKTFLGQAQSVASTASGSFKGKTESGQDAQGWPFLKDTRPPFNYYASPEGGIPPMPVRGNDPKKAKTQNEIDVPESLLKSLGLTP